jgi:serine acetyltransferase
MSSPLVDWTVNRGDLRIQLALVLYRTSHLLRTSKSASMRKLGRVVSLGYLVIVEWTWGMEIPWATQIGPRLRIFHGTGIVINAESVLGADVVLRQGVCLGNRRSGGGSPRVGNRVDFGAASLVLGPYSIGDDSKIGAASVVLADVEAGAVVVGNPARTVKPRIS